MRNSLRGHALASVLAGAALLASAGVSRADDKAEADKLFKQGRALMTAKDYAAACPAFVQSFALDPAIGTQLNIALCYEEAGLLAKAHQAYIDAEKLALDKGDSRAAAARKRAASIETRVPKLTVVVTGDVPANAVVLIDDRELASSDLGLPQLVDPGQRVVVLRVGGAEVARKTVTLAEGGRDSVSLAAGGKKVTPPPPDPDGDDDKPPPPPPPDPGKGRRLIGIAVAGVGAAAMAGGIGLAFKARGDYRKAFDGHCNETTKACDDVGYQGTRDARSQANLASIIVGVGVAAIGGGVFLYLTAPHAGAEETALRLVPQVGPDDVGLVLTGSL